VRDLAHLLVHQLAVLGFLIEHYGGKFPLWLAPVQVKVIPVSEGQFQKAKEITNSLREQFIRAEVDLGNDGFGKKIRNAKNSRIPYFIIIGEKDLQANKITLESRDHGQIGQMDEAEVQKRLLQEIKDRI
jgi:threonyl-tRNA synthetase